MTRYKKLTDEHGNAIAEHRVVWEQAHGKKVPKGYDIHHIDGNGKNNDPSNLVAIPHADHMKLHSDMRKAGIDPVDATDPDVIKARADAAAYSAAHREERREYCRKRWKENPDVRAKAAMYREDHKEAHAAHSRKYYATHREQCLAADKRYREEHHEEVTAKAREFYAENKERIREVQREYELEHKAERKQRNTTYLEQHREERKAYMRALNGRKTLERLIAHGAPQEQIDAVKKRIEEAQAEFQVLKTARGVV